MFNGMDLEVVSFRVIERRLKDVIQTPRNEIRDATEADMSLRMAEIEER